MHLGSSCKSEACVTTPKGKRAVTLLQATYHLWSVGLPTYPGFFTHLSKVAIHHGPKELCTWKLQLEGFSGFCKLCVHVCLFNSVVAGNSIPHVTFAAREGVQTSMGCLHQTCEDAALSPKEESLRGRWVSSEGFALHHPPNRKRYICQ